MWLVSRGLGLIGKADNIEFHRPESQAALPADATPTPATPWDRQFPAGFRLARLGGDPRPRAISRRVQTGRWKRWDHDDVAICAQALCLEEMLSVAVPQGAIFHVKSRQRRGVVFDAECGEKPKATQRLRNSSRRALPRWPSTPRNATAARLKGLWAAQSPCAQRAAIAFLSVLGQRGNALRDEFPQTLHGRFGFSPQFGVEDDTASLPALDVEDRAVGERRRRAFLQALGGAVSVRRRGPRVLTRSSV